MKSDEDSNSTIQSWSQSLSLINNNDNISEITTLVVSNLTGSTSEQCEPTMVNNSLPYQPTIWVKMFHSAPHVNFTFHHVCSRFNPKNKIYLESLGILASVPAAGNFCMHF